MLLENKTAVIYGGGGAIGGAVARVFAGEGARVFLAGRRQPALQRVADEIAHAGGTAETALIDALDERAVDEYVAGVAGRAGSIDISFNAISHGDVHGMPLLEMPYEEFERPVSRAIRANFLTTRAAARQMAKRQSGVIMGITATTARHAIPEVGGTGVAFDAIESLFRQWAAELGPLGIRVVWLHTTGIPEAFHGPGGQQPAYGTGRPMSGVEVDTAGDSFFAAFPTPHGAVKAAVMAQRGLQSHEWPGGALVRVRMGVHTGEGVASGSHYVGMDVHRAARIGAAAHGGQVIVSAATRGLVEHSLPAETTLRDLGEHRLKDIPHLEHLFDLVVAGLPADYPPPRTLDARPNNLPAQLTSFIGREEQIAEIRQLFDRTRLLTLTGPGGAGKTRLALQIAAETLTEYRDGSFFVDLASVTDPVLVPAVIARALGVPEAPGVSIVESLQTHLRERELLLVVDNFEQVAIGAPVLEQLLTAAPKVKALVTSRVVLSLKGEHVYAVPPLKPPRHGQIDLADVERFDAVRLFTERAQAAQPRFRLTTQNVQAVAEITARLDGLPLAIELAAARTKVLSPEQLLARLQPSLTLLTSAARTVPERQRTLRGAISWSYDLLTEAERRLFTLLSVFRGGWTLAAAESIARPEELGPDTLGGLSSLVDKSLIRADDPSGQPRFSMLDTIREFAEEQLSSGELEAVRQRHGYYFLEFAGAAEAHLTGADQGEWLAALEREHANLREALRWAVDTDQAQLAQEAAGALWRFWHQHGHLAEGRRWFDEILATPSGRQPTAARGKALTGAGGISWWQIDHSSARAFYDEALAVERQGGEPARMPQALYNDAFAVGAAGDLQAANRLLEESLDLYRQVDDE